MANLVQTCESFSCSEVHRVHWHTYTMVPHTHTHTLARFTSVGTKSEANNGPIEMRIISSDMYSSVGGSLIEASPLKEELKLLKPALCLSLIHYVSVVYCMRLI